MTKKVRAFFIIALMMLTLSAFGTGQPEDTTAASAEEVEFILLNGGEPETIDPSLISGNPEHRIYMALFEGLMTYDPETADPVLGLAKSYTISDDGLTYTFTLRDNIVWNDGTPIDAGQFVTSWLRFLNPETAAEYAYMMNMVVKGAEEYNSGEAGPEAVQIRALDDKTFQFDMKGPAPYALGMLAHYAFAVTPDHVIKKFGDEWTKPENFVSNGPFMLDEWKPQEYLSVKRNPKYWDAASVKLDKVSFLPIDDNNTAYNMYKNGEIDWITEIPLDALDEANIQDDYHNTPVMVVYYYAINNLKEPLTDVRVRKALAMAIDRTELVEKVTRGGQAPAYSIVPPMAGYEPPETFNEDYEMARQLLADAGFPNGEGFPDMEILYNTSEGHKKIAEYIQQKWKEVLNINFTPVNQEWATYINNRQEGNFDVARAGWQGDYKDPNTFLDLFLSDSDINGGKYNNPKYDELIKKAALMKAGKERYAVLAEADKLLFEDMGIIPIYFYTLDHMIDLDVWGGWYTNVLDIQPVKNIYKK